MFVWLGSMGYTLYACPVSSNLSSPSSDVAGKNNAGVAILGVWFFGLIMTVLAP